MIDAYLAIATHPLVPVFLLGCLAVFVVTHLPSLPPSRRINRMWLRGNYVFLVLGVAGTLAIAALVFYLFEIGLSVQAMVDLLKTEAHRGLPDAVSDRTDAANTLRSLSHAVAVLIGVLAASATLVFSLIKVWVNERTATATEQRLITEQINKAVEGLGAEKRIKFRGRDVQWSRIDNQGVERREGFFQKWGEGPDIKNRLPSDFDGMSESRIDKFVRFGDWTDVEESVPNLEVRIGSIYALERISQDSDRDHIRIMEILCAYIRENAPAEKAVPFPQEWAEAFEAEWDDKSVERPDRSAILIWARALPKPRVDIQTALDVIGRRDPKKIALERAPDPRSVDGYRLDLRGTNLQRYDLSNLDFDRAILSEAQLQGAILGLAQMQGADLWQAQMQGTDMTFANLQGADLMEAQMQEVYLNEAQMQGANLMGAQLQGTDFMKALLQGADLKWTHLHLANLEQAQLQKADIWQAQMQGAYLGEAEFDETTSRRPATLKGAGLREVDVSMLDLTPDLVNETFGDRSTILSDDMRKAFGDYGQPAHWPDKKADEVEFHDAWRAWHLKTFGTYPDGTKPDK